MAITHTFVSAIADGGDTSLVQPSNWNAAHAGSPIAWTEVTGASQNMATNNGYIANNAGLVTVTLPTTLALGDIVEVVGKGAGGWKIAQNAGQTIHFGSLDTTAGTGGSLASTNRYDSIALRCITADTDLSVLGVQGNLTIV